jgi:RNA polymerase sigma-70 factor (ECF subfamily)
MAMITSWSSIVSPPSSSAASLAVGFPRTAVAKIDVNDATDLNLFMARLADGDRSAFTPVFRFLWPPILRLCTAMLKNEADAQDAAQQSMAKVLSRASDYDATRPALPWAMAIAAWECRTILRKRVRRRELPEDSADEPATQAAEEDLISRNLTQAALEALGQLSAADKETLVATFWGESSTASGATLRKRRERALHRLREAFRKIYGIG